MTFHDADVDDQFSRTTTTELLFTEPFVVFALLLVCLAVERYVCGNC